MYSAADPCLKHYTVIMLLKTIKMRLKSRKQQRNKLSSMCVYMLLYNNIFYQKPYLLLFVSWAIQISKCSGYNHVHTFWKWIYRCCLYIEHLTDLFIYSFVSYFIVDVMCVIALIILVCMVAIRRLAGLNRNSHQRRLECGVQTTRTICRTTHIKYFSPKISNYNIDDIAIFKPPSHVLGASVNSWYPNFCRKARKAAQKTDM